MERLKDIGAHPSLPASHVCPLVQAQDGNEQIITATCLSNLEMEAVKFTNEFTDGYIYRFYVLFKSFAHLVGEEIDGGICFYDWLKDSLPFWNKFEAEYGNISDMSSGDLQRILDCFRECLCRNARTLWNCFHNNCRRWPGRQATNTGRQMQFLRQRHEGHLGISKGPRRLHMPNVTVSSWMEGTCLKNP